METAVFTGSKKHKVSGSRVDLEYRKRAEAVIAHSALTNSKRPECFVNGFYPTHFTGGNGVCLTDTRNNKYTDFICGLGSNLLGYGHTLTVDAAIQALKRGPTLSFSSTVEVELAEKIIEIMPFIQKVRFLKSGSEGCAASVRIARAFTGRNVILSEGYHGFHDEFTSLTPPANGVPPHLFIKPLSPDLIDETVGGVILEPIMTDMSDERIKWLRDIRERCTKVGALLIFDETITALRFPRFCVANYLGIEPDLIVFGKALANGMPISCVGGRGDAMNSDYFVSSTFAGETASLSAALACLKALQKSYDINHLWSAGSRFQARFNELSEHVKIEGYPTRGVLKGEDLPKALFMQESCRAGLLFGASWFYAFPHIDLEDQILAILKDVFFRLNSSNIKLEGALPKKPIAQTIRERKSA